MLSNSSTIHRSNNTAGAARHGTGQYSFDFAIPFAVTSGSLCVVGAFSNFFVMLLLVKYMKKPKNMEMYIFSMCLSDFLLNVVLQPHIIQRVFATNRASNIERSAMHGEITTLFLSSTSSLFFATLDKYLLIQFPLRYARYITKRTTKVTVAIIWLVSFVLGISWSLDSKNTSTISACAVGGIFVLTIIIQVLIYIAARKQDKKVKNIYLSVKYNHPKCCARTSSPNKASTKATTTIALMMTVYICSWLPTNFYRLHYKLTGGDSSVYHKWLKVTNMMVQLHTCINPYVYIARAKEAKRSVRAMLKQLGVKDPSCFTKSPEVNDCMHLEMGHMNGQAILDPYDENGIPKRFYRHLPNVFTGKSEHQHQNNNNVKITSFSKSVSDFTSELQEQQTSTTGNGYEESVTGQATVEHIL